MEMGNRERGFIGIMMMMGLLALTLMGLLTTSYQRREIQIRGENKFAIDILQQNYSVFIQDEESWKKTLNDPRNTSFACILNSTSCQQSPQPIVVLKNAKDEIVVDGDYTKGITQDGKVCDSGSDPVHGNGQNSSCDLKVNLTWTPVCQAPCINPRVIQVNVGIAKSTSSSSARFIASSAAGIIRRPMAMPIVSQIGVGKYHTCALAEGSVYCWGENSGGELGLGSTGGTHRTPEKVSAVPNGVTKISVGMGTTCVVQAGNVWCWGWYFGAAPRRIFDSSTGTPLQNVVDVSTNFGHGCAVTSNRAAYCWGGNMNAQLGYSIPPGLDFPTDYNTWSGANGPAFPVYGLSRGINGPDLGKVVDINASLGKSLAVVDNGTNSFVMEWGNMESNYGNSFATWDFFIMGVSAFYDVYSPFHSNYKVCWPHEHKGPPALPNNNSTPWFRHGLYLPPNPPSNPLGGGDLGFDTSKCNPVPEKSDYAILQTNVKQILNSYGTKCALLNNGDIACGGTYDYGRMATNPPNANKTPHLATTIHGIEILGANSAGFYAIKNGELWAWGFNNAGNALGDPAGSFAWPYWGSVWQPFKVNLPPGVTNVMQGGSDEGYHMCAVASGIAYCWGQNDRGQLGDGTTTSRLTGNPVMVTTWP